MKNEKVKMERIAEINRHIRDGINEWADIMLLADADEWSFHLNYSPRDVENACLIFKHVCSNVGIKRGRIDEAKAVEFGRRLRQFVMDMTGFDPTEIVGKGGEDEKD